MGPDELKAWRSARRKAFVDRRAAWTGVDRERADAALHANVFTCLGSVRPGSVLGFCWPFKGEFDCRPLVLEAIARGCRAALPVVVAPRTPLAFREWVPGAPMEADHHGIPVPASEAAALAPDVVLLPMNGFDAKGYRLGYGGGYFDRTLAAAPRRPYVIGLCYEFGRLETLHPQPHDIALDVVVTEAGVHRRL